MKFLGRLIPPSKGEKYWSAEVPELGVFTQGKTEKEAHAMIIDALEFLADEKDFKVDLQPTSTHKFSVTSSNLRPLFALYLQTMRLESELTIQEVADRLGLASKNGYAQYEQGKALPSIELLSEFIKAMRPGKDLYLKVG